MNDFEKYAQKKVEEYKNILGLNLIEVNFEQSDDEDYLAIACVYPYQDTFIKYSDKVLRDYSNKQFDDKKLLHELVHMITDPLYCKALQRFTHRQEIEDERELLTDKITLIIDNIYKKRNGKKGKTKQI